LAQPLAARWKNAKRATECDALVAIVAHRYGWIPSVEEGGDGDKSITWIEIETALEAGKDVFAFLVDPDYHWPYSKESDGLNAAKDNAKALEIFHKVQKLKELKTLLNKRVRSNFTTPDNLASKVASSLSNWLNENKTQKSLPGEPKPRPELKSELDKEIQNYREKAESFYKDLPLAGFGIKLRVNIDLADLYVPLNAMLDLRGVGEACYADAKDAEEKLRDKCCEINLIDAFREATKRNQRGLAILGDPGSGKTTHLKRILLKCLRQGSESLGLPQNMLPVFLPLRELKDLDHGLDAFIQEQLDQPHLETPKGFGKRLLERGNLLFLLDGLDEVAELGHREKVSRWIDDAAKAHAKNMFVVTCRFAGYTNNVRLSADFLEMHVRPMTAEQADAFVHNWYKIVERGLAVDPDQGETIGKERADELVERLKQPDFRARRVFELTRNPLLLTNLCLVHRDRGRLPHRRADLYDECIDVLLERWRDAKKLDIGVGARVGRKVLQPAALWLHQEDARTRAQADELAPVIEPPLKDATYDKEDAKDFLKTVRDESGLLVGWGDESYGFMHLGFQEFLAAREIRSRFCLKDEVPFSELAGHFGESWWQEVILLLLALEDPPLFEPFMREVVKLPVFAEKSEFVEACLDDAFTVSAAPFMELLKKSPGNRKELWQRQLAALRVLDRLKAEELEALRRELQNHPSPEIRQWLGVQVKKAAQTVSMAPKGGCELVHIPAGKFLMGGNEDSDEKPVHEVNVREFLLGRYPVTNEEYGRFLKETSANEPKYWGDRRFNQPKQPVVGVSWNDAKAFAQWAGGRLPSEAEWEYACRAGTTTDYCSGNGLEALKQVGWCRYDNSLGSVWQTKPVGSFSPNVFGLYDMHGNVWEWCEDDWHGNYDGAPKDGSAWIDDQRGSSRIVRGGSWRNDPERCRSASRGSGHPGHCHRVLGFRLLLDLK